MADSRQTKIVSYKLQGDSTDLMHELQSAISTLDALDSKLTHISTEARMLGGKDKTSLARASAISTAETQIEKLRATLNPENIQAVSPDQLNLIKQMNAELTGLMGKLDKFKSAQTVTQKALDKTKTSLHTMNLALRNSNIVLPKTAKAWDTFASSVYKAQAIISIIKLIISYLGKLYESAGDFVETMNLFNVATQESTQELYELAEAMERAYNTDIAPILNSMAVFRQYANTMGFAADQADILSEYLTKITYDLASLYNVANTDMAKAIKSGLAGQTRPLMQYGISVHKATLEQYALNLGLEKSWSAFSETEKVALRYIAILDQATLAQGDLAKTLESPSNQLKIAKAQLEVFIRNLGSLVTIMSRYVLPVFNGFMISLNAFLGALSKAAGYEIPDYSDNLSANNQMLDDGTESAEEYEDAMKGALAPLDEINQQSNKDNALIGGLDPKILAALEGYDNLMDKITTKTDALAEAFGGIIPEELGEGVGSVLGAAFTTLGGAIDVVTQALETASPILSVVLNILGLLLKGVGWLLEHVVSPVLSFVEALTSNIWLLVAAFAALNLMQLAATGNFQSMYAVKMAQWFAGLTGKIVANTAAMLANAAASLKAKAASLILAAATWWEAAAWWQKAIAIIAAAGALALVVGGIVIAATSSAKSQADSTMNASPNIPAMAQGGVVSSPTVALIGEGRYREAVVPLGNSPQFKTMKDDIASEVLRKIGPAPSRFGQPSADSNRPVVLQVDGKELARVLMPSISKAQVQTGVKLKR